MAAIKMIHDLLPSALNGASPRVKRRKTHFGDNEHCQYPQKNMNGVLSTAPSILVSRELNNHGMPDRLDPFSIDYLMDFDYPNGNRHSDIPPDILRAIQYGNLDKVVQHYKSKDRLVAQRNSQGETLLHLACRYGSVAIIKSFLCDFKISSFVLDKQGRSPLHSLCDGTNFGSVNGSTNLRISNHLESMRLLLQIEPTLILYKDKNGKVPLEYLQLISYSANDNPLHWKLVNEMLFSERIVKRVVEEKSRLGQRMTAWEKINNLIDLSGLDEAVMETGFSI